MRLMVEAMAVQWGLQQVRDTELTVGDTMESSLDVRSTPLRCATFPPLSVSEHVTPPTGETTYQHPTRPSHYHACSAEHLTNVVDLACAGTSNVRDRQAFEVRVGATTRK